VVEKSDGVGTMGSKERTGQACDKVQGRTSERVVSVMGKVALDREHWRSIGKAYAQKWELGSAATSIGVLCTWE